MIPETESTLTPIYKIPLANMNSESMSQVKIVINYIALLA